MNRDYLCSRIDEAIKQFPFLGTYVSHDHYGSGHINDTFCVVFSEKRYILQRMNTEVFKNPTELMSNILGVTTFLKAKNANTLTVILTANNEPFYTDSINSCWRVYEFIEGAKTYDKVEKIEHFYESGVAFGTFQKLLSNYPAETLNETIENFHNTRIRFQNFKSALLQNPKGRIENIQSEVDFVLAHEKDASIMVDMLKRGELPLRVTHNDTKFNNVMIDDVTGKGSCVIDLDTVMPGLVGNDFGDAIRSGCNPVSEDEKDLSKVIFNVDYYNTFLNGFLTSCGDSLTKNELDTLPLSAKLMTLECGIRFLTDYIQGDTYFKIHHENHNLDRCRTQFKLVKDMEEML